MEHATPTEQVIRVPAGTLARVFLRSLVLQASWNRRGMQNLGFAYALWPALEILYTDRHDRARAAARHLSFFNTHPYLASAILGGAVFHEERVAAGAEPPEAVERFKQALQGPFAAVGDSFFWLSLRPFAGAVAAVLAPAIGLWSVALFLALYNVPHLLLRISLFIGGVRKGDRVVENVARVGLPKHGARLRRATAVLGGAAATLGGLAAYQLWRPEPAAGGLALGLGAAALTFTGSYVLLGRKGPILAAWSAVVLGLLLALAGGYL